MTILAEMAGMSSRTTHRDQRAVDAYRFHAKPIATCIKAEPNQKDTLIERVIFELAEPELHPKIQASVNGSYREKASPEVKGTGFVVQPLEAALWAVDLRRLLSRVSSSCHKS